MVDQKQRAHSVHAHVEGRRHTWGHTERSLQNDSHYTCPFFFLPLLRFFSAPCDIKQAATTSTVTEEKRKEQEGHAGIKLQGRFWNLGPHMAGWTASTLPVPLGSLPSGQCRQGYENSFPFPSSLSSITLTFKKQKTKHSMISQLYPTTDIYGCL